MKLYTSLAQTAKLIEYGFEKPRSIGGYEPTYIVEYEGEEVSNVIIGENKQCPIYAYSIGELIEMLPSHIGWCELNIWHIWHLERWVICFDPEKYTSAATELIDAAYDLIVKLKEDGVI